MDRNDICPLPWTSIQIHPSGGVKACCIQKDFYESKNVFDAINSKTAFKIRNDFQNGVFPVGCNTCFEKEKRGARSVRSIFLKDPKVNPFDSNKTSLSLEDITYLDIALSNKCNLRCRFCGPNNSSRWIEDIPQLIGNNIALFPNDSDLNFTQSTFNLSNLFESILKMNNLRTIEVKGGEPFIQSEFIDLLEFLVSNNLAKNLELSVVTNGTIVSEKILKLLTNFSNLNIGFSIEATGAAYQYIRGEKYLLENDILNNWKKIVEKTNVNKIREMRVLTNVSILNSYDLKNLEFQLKEKFNLTEKNWAINLLVGPRCLSIYSLPKALRHDLFSELNSGYTKKISNWFKEEPETSYYKEFGLREFVDSMSKLDHMRGISGGLQSAIPNLYDSILPYISR
jgi:organic radical activating enzyme